MYKFDKIKKWYWYTINYLYIHLNYSVHSIANYGIVAWGGAYENVIKPLQNLQNRLLKIVLNTNEQIIRPLNF